MCVTISGAARGSELVPQSTLDSVLQHAPGGTPGFKGIITADIVATQAQIKQLLSDSRVYVTDVTYAIAAQRARAALASSNANAANLPIVASATKPLYWDLEETGIAPKQ